ncbi:MAG: DUF7483 domain-containing protein [bacterium]
MEITPLLKETSHICRKQSLAGWPRLAALALVTSIAGVVLGLGTQLHKFQVSSAATPMRVATGSFTGNGTDDRAITGVGFQPDVVFVKCDCAQAAVARTSTMAGDASKVLGAATALQADQVQSLDADGFTVGTSSRVNNSGKTIYWTAMKAGDELKVSSYVGNGVDDRSITGVGLQPIWVITMGDGNDSLFRPATVAGDASFVIDGSAQVTNRIQALQADGFQIGTNATVNQSGTTYHYIAWAASANVV